MTIHRVLRDHAFDPEMVAVMASAFEAALRKLELTNRADPVTEIVARKIIELAQQGERDPGLLVRGRCEFDREIREISGLLEMKRLRGG
jgi:hypothetical protein